MKAAETYVQMKERHQKEVNEFPMMWAFNNDQFAQGMKKLGLQETDTDKIYRIAPGGFIRKTDADKLDEMFTRHEKEREEAMAADIDGMGYLFQIQLHGGCRGDAGRFGPYLRRREQLSGNESGPRRSD